MIRPRCLFHSSGDGAFEGEEPRRPDSTVRASPPALPQLRRRQLPGSRWDHTFQAAALELKMKEPSLQLGSKVCTNIQCPLQRGHFIPQFDKCVEGEPGMLLSS